jgi:hypothetical protein
VAELTDAQDLSSGRTERSARDFFEALVALGMLTRTGSTYSNTAETDLFLDRGKPSYAGGMLEMANARLYPFWGSLTEGLRTGQPQNETKAGGSNVFATIYAEPARLRQFLSAMTGISIAAAVAIAKQFPWKNYKTFVDVGGAQGAVPVQVALAHPHLTGGEFDLAPVGPIFADYVKSFGLQHRLTFTAGDFFKDSLPHADVGRCDRPPRIDHRRRPIQECVRPAHEPEYADRDAGRLRLFGRRRDQVDEAHRFQKGVRRTSCRTRFHGGRYQVAAEWTT